MTWTKGTHGTGHGGPAKGAGVVQQAGNVASLKSGWRSPRVIARTAEQLAAALLEDRPDLQAFPEALAAWADSEARCVLIRRRLDQSAFDEETNEPRSRTWQILAQFEKLAIQHRATLGLDPRSQASLARERAEAVHYSMDLETLAERGRQILADRAVAEAIEAVKSEALEQ